MDCSQTKQLAKDYFSSLCPEEIQKEIEDHLSSCETCARYYEEFKNKILPFLGTEIYPFQKNAKIRFYPERSVKKRFRPRGSKWQRILPNILTGISLIIIVIMLAIVQRKLSPTWKIRSTNTGTYSAL